MNRLLDHVQDYCHSERFFFLDASLKEYAEELLSYWVNQAGAKPTSDSIAKALQRMATLEAPLSVRKAIPSLLKAFFDYLATSGAVPDADRWIPVVSRLEVSYGEHFREDGSVRGTTFRKPPIQISRNAPCPCGSGKKYKKCCGSLP